MVSATDTSYRHARIHPDPEPRTTFSYYGGKSKLVGRYPIPTKRLIVEPFGGAGAYAWRYRDRADVWINDLDPITYSIWVFLQSPDLFAALDRLPTRVEPGQEIADIVPADAPPGLDALIRAELSRGTQGRRDIGTRATAFGAHYYWPRFAGRFKVVGPAIAKWRITNLDYRELKNVEATWFVDPPYNNDAGRRYRCAALDYAALGRWAVARRGQVIVCENVGATWLPFAPLVNRRIGRHPLTTNIGEAVWEGAEQEPRLFR